MAAEWLSMTTTSLAHVADFDFVGIGVSIAPPQVVKLQTSHCFIRIMAQWVTDTFKKETFVVNMVCDLPERFVTSCVYSGRFSFAGRCHATYGF